ncbi:MAG: hypothetical protein B7Z20_06150 [Sphingobium sp. 32-64-5]|nr:MAG: hypothetical protein B7Z20_06150 [Sphingobium sp. 32-64-5]
MADEKSDRFALPLLAAGQAQKEMTHNEALALIDMLLHPQAESLALTTPPETAQAGQCWIVAAGASGAWSGHDASVAALTAGGWRFVGPRTGMRVAVSEEDMTYIYDGAQWSPEGLRPDGLYIAESRVVGPRAAAIADPDGGTVIDGEARLVLGQLLAVLRSHGLIAMA